MTQIGTIYVPVKGDTTQFQKDMTNLRTWAYKSGTEVANALNSAISQKTAGSGVTTLANNLKQLAQGAKVPMDQFRTTAAALSDALKDVAQQAGLTKQQFTDMTEKMLRTQAMNTATTSLKNAANTMGLTSSEAKALAIQMGYTGAQAEKMSAAMLRANAAAKDSVSAFSGFRSSMVTAITTLAGFGTAISAAYKIKELGVEVFKTAQATLVAENAYKAITRSTKAASAEFDFLRATSEKLGLNFYTLRDGYKGFLAAAQSSKIPMEEVRNIFTSISNAGAIMGLSNERMSLTFLALEQMMSKGKVSMEELRRQLGDNLPGAFQIGAKAMGMTVEAFDAAVSAGTVYSDDFLPKFRKEMDRTFQGTVADSVKAINKLAEAWEDSKNKMANAGFFESMTDAIKELTEILVSDKFITGSSYIIEFLGELVFFSVSKAKDIGNLFGMIAGGAKAIGEAWDRSKTKGIDLDKLFKDSGSIEKYQQRLKEIKALYSEKLTEDSWVRSGYQWTNNWLELIDPFIENTQRAKQVLAQQLSGLPEFEKAMTQSAGKRDENELLALEKNLALMKQYQSDKVDVIKEAELKIAEIKERLAAPAEKAAKKQKELEEERAKAVAKVADEYNKLTMSVQEYQKFENAEWYAEQVKAIGSETEALKKLAEVKEDMRLNRGPLFSPSIPTPDLQMTDEERAKAVRDASEAHMKFTDDYKKATLSKYDYEREQAKKTYDDWIKKEEDKVKAYEMYSATMRKIAKDEAAESDKEWKEVFSGWGREWSKTLNDMVWGAKLSFGNILESFGKMLTQMMIQKKLVEPVVKSFSGSSLFSGVAGLFTGGGNFDPFNLISFADGGILNERVTGIGQTSGRSYEFGEAGPEVFMPKNSIGGSKVEVVIVNAPPVQEQKRTQTSGGGERLEIIFERQMSGVAAGKNSFTNILETRYGLRPSLVGR